VGRLWLALGLIVMLAGPAAAQDEEITRPCRRADLIGLWRVIRFGFAAGATVDRADPAYQPYQRYVFNANATMGYVASDVPPTPADNRTLLLTPAPVTWAVDAGGRLMRQTAGATRVDRSDCRVVTRAIRDPRSRVPGLPGDVLLTDRGEDERPITRRLLRKLQANE
jgi:hypothetical protein